VIARARQVGASHSLGEPTKRRSLRDDGCFLWFDDSFATIATSACEKPTTDEDAVYESEWQTLHDRMIETLDQFGKKDGFRRGDYWLVDESWGWERQQVEVQNLEFLRPNVIKALQALLADFPKWDIAIMVDVPGTEDTWPGMGLIVSRKRIVDDLQREFLPEQYRDLAYEGAQRFPDITK
jgi:hypothetical protein